MVFWMNIVQFLRLQMRKWLYQRASTRIDHFILERLFVADAIKKAEGNCRRPPLMNAPACSYMPIASFTS
jgi:hypothetical protein